MTNAEIGIRIAERRNELGLTMDEVAQKIGVAKSTIQRYEKGQIKKIKLPVIESIAAALFVNPDWLIGNTDNPAPNVNNPCDLPDKIPFPRAAFVVEPDEEQLIRKYRVLDERGKAAVLNTLNHEYESYIGENAQASAKEA